MPEGMEDMRGQRSDGTQDGNGFDGVQGDFGVRGGMGGGMMGGNASADCLIQINGGTVTINAGGDAVDSNGCIEATGEMLLGASSGQGDRALDAEMGATVTGGTVILASAAGMAEWAIAATRIMPAPRVVAKAHSLCQECGRPFPRRFFCSRRGSGWMQECPLPQ